MRSLQTLISTILVVVLVGLSAISIFRLGINTASLFNPQPKTVSVYADPGGNVFDNIDKWGRIGDDGSKVQVKGLCASACTFMFGYVKPENICATDNAVFLFHGIYGMMGFEKEMTQLLLPIIYPNYIVEALKEKGFDGSADVDKEVYPTGFIELTREELRINEC